MNVAMMQPSFMPWQGFFELIYKSDIFIFLDDFQFSVQSWHQRNRLFVNKGQVGWYSVPVQKTICFKSPLNETKINESTPWREKMWKRIQQNYSKASYYDEIAPQVQQWLLAKYESLATQNIAFITLVCNLLGISREFRLSSQLCSEKQRSHRVVELLQWCGVKCYFCACGSFGYMYNDSLFPVKGVEVLFQDFQPQPYAQTGSTGDFVPYLSILDALMNIGARKTLELIVNGTSKWQTWDSMKEDLIKGRLECQLS